MTTTKLRRNSLSNSPELSPSSYCSSPEMNHPKQPCNVEYTSITHASEILLSATGSWLPSSTT